MFSSDDIARFYPFGDKQRRRHRRGEGTDRSRRGERRKGIFDQAAWDDATRQGAATPTRTKATSTRASGRSSSARKVGQDSVPTVDLRWEIDERTPAIVNRVDILGNDVTTETCIRDQFFIVPGDVFNRDG